MPSTHRWSSNNTPNKNSNKPNHPNRPVTKQGFNHGFGAAMEDQKFEDTIYWGIIIASLIGIVVIASFIILNQATSAEQNAFTAIYFGDYNKDLTSKTTDFNFTIENHENKNMVYTIDINFDSTIVKTIEAVVPKDQNFYQTINIPFGLDQRSVHKISVGLRDRPENIHYWTRVKKEYPVTFGENNIAFLGFSVSPQRIRPNQDFNITYNWKCLQPTDINYTVFVHFVDSTGKIILQNDHAPQTSIDGNQTAYPTSQCTPSTLFSETYSLKTSQANTLEIRIGLYTKDAGRLPTDNDNPDNYYTMGTIKIE